MTNVKAIILGLVSIIITAGMMGVVLAKPDEPSELRCVHNRLDLKLMDQDESWSDGVNSTWVALNMMPGNDYSFEGSFVGLKSKSAGWIEIGCDYAVSEEFPPVESDTDPLSNLAPDKMAKELIITRAVYEIGCWQIDLLSGGVSGMSFADQLTYCRGLFFWWRIRDIDNDGRITFYDLGRAPVGSLPLIASDREAARFQMSVKFAETADNDLQGDTFNLKMLYTLKTW
jgi:hypothetical protein